MTKQITIDGPTITRNDGSTVHAVAYLDTDGNLLGNAFVPEGYTPTVPDVVADYRVIEADTDIADLPQNAEPDPPETAMDKIRKLDVPDDSPM